MRFRTLYLKAYGPFTERVIDFDTSKASLHILYGPNEAGKSSLLRAIHAYLFGILERPQDNFLHDNAVLRIGGLITDGADVTLAAMRRKSRKQSLRQWTGKRGSDCEGDALPDNTIAHLLGDIDEAQFSRLFGIDRDELIRGGRAILEGQGDVGVSLFEAGSGLVGLRRLRDSLDVEAAGLFAQRASKPLINATISEYDDARRTAKDAAVRTDEWVQRDSANTTAINALDANKQVITSRRLDRERLARIFRNHPLIARRENYLTELHGLSEVPDLDEDFAERRARVVAAKASAEQYHNEAQKKVAEFETQLAGANIPRGFVERGSLIQGVYSRLGAFQKADLELPGLEARLRSLHEEARTKFQELNLAGELAGAEKVRPKKHDQTKLRGLIATHSDLSGRKAELERQEIELKFNLEKAQHTFDALKQPQDPACLDDAVQAASVHADTERRLAELLRDIATRKESLGHKVSGLGDRKADDLREIRAPAKATLQRLQQGTNAISSERNVVNSQLKERQSDLAARQAEKQKLEAAGMVPSEEEVLKAREYRDLGWKSIRQGYIERTADPEILGKQYTPEVGLPQAYEHAVQHADAVVDGLRRETERIAAHRIMLDRVAELSTAILEDQAKLMELNSRQDKWQEEWSGITSSLGISSMTVRELEEWLAERDIIVADLGEIEQRQRDAEVLKCDMLVVRDVLVREVQAQGASVSDSDSFGAMLVKARRLLENSRREMADYGLAKKRVEDLQLELIGQQRRISGLNEELTTWRTQWNAAAESIGSIPNVEPQEAEARLSLLEELFKAIDEKNRVEHELSEKQATINRYSEEVGSLATALGISSKERQISDVVVDIFSQYTVAVKKTQHREQVSTQLEGQREVLETSKNQLDRANNELTGLCRAAGVVEFADLPAVEEKARRKRDFQGQVSLIEQQLIEQNGAALDRVVDEANAVDRDTLNVKIPEIDDEIKDLELSRDTLAQQARDAEVALKQIDGSEKAADATQRAQELLARLRTATEDYARLKMSSFVITRAIETYRQKHQGPILKRASEYFSTLTRDSFKRLDVDFSEDDRQVLVGVRSNGKHVSVDGMSEGTRDQLYLALRLAGIESHLEAGPSIPVIVDDVLVQFDDDRAKSAFEALEILAARTQVILLTHHSHLISLAEKAVRKGILSVHRLDLPSAE